MRKQGKTVFTQTLATDLATERNITLDYLKLIFSFLVISIHVHECFSEIPYLGWSIAQGISTVAVPCFFIINGFYLAPIIDNSKKVKKYLTRMLMLYIVWMIIYIPFYKSNIMIGPDKLYNTVLTLIFGWVHLWYISALIMATAALHLLRKAKVNSKLMIAVSAFILLFLYIAERQYLFGIDYPILQTLSRNSILKALPYVFFGTYIAQNNITQTMKVSKKTYALIAALALLVMLESLVGYTHGEQRTDIYLVLPVLCILLFVAVYQKGKMEASDGFVSKLASAVFFCHFVVLLLIESAIGFGKTDLYLITVTLSVCMGATIVYLNKRIRIFL